MQDQWIHHSSVQPAAGKRIEAGIEELGHSIPRLFPDDVLDSLHAGYEPLRAGSWRSLNDDPSTSLMGAPRSRGDSFSRIFTRMTSIVSWSHDTDLARPTHHRPGTTVLAAARSSATNHMVVHANHSNQMSS